MLISSAIIWSMRSERYLPLAQEALNDEDWEEINAAFALNHDPMGEQMFGVAREKKFDALLATILEFTQEPAGPGSA